MSQPLIELSNQKEEAASKAVGLVWFQPAADPKASAPKGWESPIYLGQEGKEISELAKNLSQSRHFSGKKNEVAVLRFVPFSSASVLFLVGAGTKEKFTSDFARQLGAALFRAQKRERVETVALRLDSLLAAISADKHNGYVQALCEGYLMASYEYTATKPAPKEAFYPAKLLLSAGKNPAFKTAIDRATAVAQGVNFTRSLGDLPPNLMNPAELAEKVQQMAKSRKLKVSVLGKAQIEREKMGCLLGVAQGSANEPKVIVIEYRGGKKNEKPVAIVGKGVTFDSGGISLKPPAGMEEMKFDMMGAAAVAGLMQAVADLEIPVNVTGYIGAVENMPSGTAQRPADVVTAANGKTVEITNTDAEGRLVLVDVLHYAQKQKPQAIVDMATLTGAVVIALGGAATGIMGNHPGLIRRIEEASERTGEKVWELPLFEEYEEDMKSPYADIRNAGNRDAGSSKGGTFLKHFIEKGMPWVHCDIAGTGYNKSDFNYNPSKGASGVMVRLLADMLENWETLS